MRDGKYFHLAESISLSLLKLNPLLNEIDQMARPRP